MITAQYAKHKTDKIIAEADKVFVKHWLIGILKRIEHDIKERINEWWYMLYYNGLEGTTSEQRDILVWELNGMWYNTTVLINGLIVSWDNPKPVLYC